MQRAAGNAGVAQEFKSIFELGGVPAFNQYYVFGIFIWKLLYKGFYTAWHLVPAPTIENPKRKRKIFRMNMAKAVCAEMASLVIGIRQFLLDPNSTITVSSIISMITP